MKLIYNGVDLNTVCRDQISSLQLFYVCENVKPLVRLNIYEDQLEFYKMFCIHNSLFYRVSDYKVAEKDGRVGYTSKKDWVSRDSVAGFHYIYITKDPAMLKIDFDILSDYSFGELLGYPKCCLCAYDANAEKVRKNNIDFTALAIDSLQPAPFYVNTLIRYFRYAFIQHFPCSIECNESLETGKTLYNLLLNKYPHIAHEFKQHLASFVIHVGETDIYYANDFEESGSSYGRKIRFSSINCIKKTELYYDLMEEKEVDIISPNIFKVGNKVYSGEYLRTIIYK